MRPRYFPAEAPGAGGFDGAIVTGAEPRAERLDREPYWDELRRCLDWASRNTASTILSCLAAHAGVLHFDGVERQPLGAKLSGVFRIDAAAPHDFTRGLQPGFFTPHSRRNGLPEAALERAGYVMVSRSTAVGADAFVKSIGAGFLFLQGHPEYDADSLAREYRRDMNRFRTGQSSAPPSVPENYFSAEDEAALRLFTARILAAGPVRRPLPLALGLPPSSAIWRPAATALYKNWLGHLADRAQTKDAAQKPVRRYGG
jgi:homoserine O-succinyltransferase